MEKRLGFMKGPWELSEELVQWEGLPFVVTFDWG